jgi:hypothetical protein
MGRAEREVLYHLALGHAPIQTTPPHGDLTGLKPMIDALPGLPAPVTNLVWDALMWNPYVPKWLTDPADVPARSATRSCGFSARRPANANPALQGVVAPDPEPPGTRRAQRANHHQYRDPQPRAALDQVHLGGPVLHRRPDSTGRDRELVTSCSDR